jgi:LmbE family N-acetylglucosaminyl deacetylase
MTAERSDRLRVLALGAHPDDIEAGCGGALLRYARAGHRVFLMIMTEGELGGAPQVRSSEQADAAKILGAEKLFWGGYPDTAIPNDRGLVQKIERVVREVDPEVIFVHFPEDTHQDHRQVAMSTVSATRYTKNVLFYEGPTTQHFSPTVYVDIDAVLDDKIKALQAHASQVNKTNVEGLSIVDVTRSAAHFRGIQGRVRNAEAFVPLRLFLPVFP